MKANKETLNFLAQKYYEHWREDNKDFVADLEELTADFVLFNAKWGTNMSIVYGEPSQKKV